MFLERIKTEEWVACQDATPSLTQFFDPSVAPPLLFYAYIPTLLLLFGFALVVLFKERFSFVSKILFSIASLFGLWIINVLVQWTAVHANIVHFAWELIPLLEAPIYILSFYFVKYFIEQKRPAKFYDAIFLTLYAPIILLMSTNANIFSFDLVSCVGLSGYLLNYLYVLELSIILWIAFIGFMAAKKTNDFRRARSIAFLTAGIVFFMALFFISEFLGEITQFYEINLLGPIGALGFVITLAYTTIKLSVFKNLRLFGVQALVVALWVLVFSLLFVRTLNLVQTVVLVTLVLITVIGFMLIRGFNREIKQREEITQLAHDLQGANARLKELDKQKTEFVSLASHQLRGPITAINGYVGMVLTGEYGEIVNPEVREVLEKVQTAGKDLGVLVGDYLDVTRIELGRMEYSFSDVSLSTLAKEVFDQMRPVTQRANLELHTNIPDAPVMVHADANKLKQVMLNLVDNAVKYTPAGSITISVVPGDDGKVRFSVSDTGTGMSQKVLESIFQKFVRAPGAQRINTGGTGLGLFVARKIITEHKGRIWAESAGEGKGSTFSFEIDAL